MLRQALIALAACAAIVAILLAQRSIEVAEEFVGGRNNTVLILTDSHHGLCNVHLATTSAILEDHPSVEVHYASFPNIASDIVRISESARAKNPNAQIHWHGLHGPSLIDETVRALGNISGLVSPPGLAGLNGLVEAVELLTAPWSKEGHWNLYREISDLIREVDPAVVVLDSMLRPAIDATLDLNRAHAFITPNGLSFLLGQIQPWGAHYWKYPALASGISFPVPWHQIPVNIYQQLRILVGIGTSANVKEKRSYLQEKGVRHAVESFAMFMPQVPWISMSFPEAELPLDVIPGNFEIAGPIVLDVAPAETQDADLVAWLKRAPTMLVNLGSAVKYDGQMARAMVESLVPVLEATETQILWKMRKLGEYDDDAFLAPAKAHIESGRLRVERWLNADPMSLYDTGDIVVSVHHGGANCFYEAVLAGIPQVILPVWADLYNFAVIAEYLGIGVWPGKETAPIWEPARLSEGFMKALSGETSESMRQKAQALAEKAREYGGRKKAADVIVKMATEGG